MNTKVGEMLELVQLGHLAKRYPSELSGGQQQRVAIAILWRCWQDRTSYNEEKYLAALRRKKSTLIALLID